MELARSSSEIAVATDEAGGIIFWNRAAEKAFGLSAARVEGEVFPEVVQGRDLFGNRLLHEQDRFRSIVQRGEAVRSFVFEARNRRGEALRLAASVVVVLGPGAACHLVYFLRPVRSRRKTDLVAARTGDGRSRLSLLSRSDPIREAGSGSRPLTRRQAEILESFADGKTIGEISGALGISPNTVRNHAQAILERLEVHSRVEAVALALRQRLI